MARRIQIHVDILHHLNELTFAVYRSTSPTVTENDTHVMDVIQNQTIKEREWETSEILNRDPFTPYAFYVHRHYETDQRAPVVRLGSTVVEVHELNFLSTDKQVEIHSGDIGLHDGRPVYMDYEYLTQPLLDDTRIESGKVYHGPIATGLHTPFNFEVIQDFALKKFHIKYEYDLNPISYFYRILAKDTAGNVSPWSDTKMQTLSPSVVFFRVERSEDREEWEDVAFSNMREWFDEYRSVDNPENLHNAEVRPLTSKEAEISFDNPWYHYKTYPRKSYAYRVRAEDDEGQHTEWIYFESFPIFFEPKEIIIRRKLDNKSVSSIDGIDAFTLFRLDRNEINPADKRITLIDDQLTDKSKYAYTFFYEDELDKVAVPFFLTSDHTPWSNIILFPGQAQQDAVTRDFMTTFEWADRLVEIGSEEGQ